MCLPTTDSSVQICFRCIPEANTVRLVLERRKEKNRILKSQSGWPELSRARLPLAVLTFCGYLHRSCKSAAVYRPHNTLRHTHPSRSLSCRLGISAYYLVEILGFDSLIVTLNPFTVQYRKAGAAVDFHGPSSRPRRRVVVLLSIRATPERVK